MEPPICKECGDDLAVEGYRYCSECLEALGYEADLDCVDIGYTNRLDGRMTHQTPIALSDETDTLTAVPAGDLAEILEHAKATLDGMDADEAEELGMSADRVNALYAQTCRLLDALASVTA